MANPILPTRCKPGDRAKIIKAVCKENIGSVVVVVRPYLANEKIKGATWDSNGVSWVVASVGGPLISKQNTKDGSHLLCADFVAVLNDVNLVPLDDTDDGLSVVATKRKPRAKKLDAAHA